MAVDDQSFSQFTGTTTPFTLQGGLYYITFNVPDGVLYLEYQHPVAGWRQHIQMAVFFDVRVTQCNCLPGTYRFNQPGVTPCDVNMSQNVPVTGYAVAGAGSQWGG